ncbi:MAG: His/Gly/Thr/Pro-type tRNA ligase C-terminal domain-containing protein, partial [Alphaproteobacteria bacterium]
VVAEAPVFGDYLTEDAAAFFDSVCQGLDSLGIAYRLNPRLVRGLDYYCHTAFEFTTESLGAQGTVLAGGRYDGLVETMGGPKTPGVGWAAGIERLTMLDGSENKAPRAVAVIPVGADAEAEAFKITQRLRREGIAADMGFSGNLSRRMKRANRIGASFAVIVGADELARNAATLRDMDTGAQEEVALDALVGRLQSGR